METHQDDKESVYLNVFIRREFEWPFPRKLKPMQNKGINFVCLLHRSKDNKNPSSGGPKGGCLNSGFFYSILLTTLGL